MSALKRLLTGQHKIHKHNSLPNTSDGLNYLDLERVGRHQRSQSKPPTPISASTPTTSTPTVSTPTASTPTHNGSFHITSLSLTQSPTTSSASSSKSNIRHGRSRSRARAKDERARSLSVRAARHKRESVERTERRKNYYDSVSPLLPCTPALLLIVICFTRTHLRTITANFP